MQERIASLGVNNVIVRSIQPTDDDKDGVVSSTLAFGLTYDDMQRINETIDTVVSTTPQREFVHEARYGGNALDSRVVGVFANYGDGNSLEMARGRFIEDIDLKYMRNVCVLGADIAKELF